MTLRRWLGLSAAAAIALAWAGCKGGSGSSGIPEYPAINPGGDFTLTDQDAKPFHLRDHRGQVVLVFFGYLSCPDVCPAMLSKLAAVYSKLGPELRPRVLTTFISIDTDRDTPDKLKSYLAYFDVNAAGLTGTRAQVDQVVNAYKASYKKVQTNSAMGVLYDHSDILYVTDPQGMVRGFFRPDDKAEDIAALIKKLLS